MQNGNQIMVLALIAIATIVLLGGLFFLVFSNPIPPVSPPLTNDSSPNANSENPYESPFAPEPVISEPFSQLDSNGVIEPDLNLSQLEFRMHEAINEQRISNGLAPIQWNSAIASVARRHSNELAYENIDLADFYLIFPDPYISHEGFSTGFHHNDRLNFAKVYYFSASAENVLAHPFSKNKTYAMFEAPVEPPEIELPVGPANETNVQTLQRLRTYLDQKHERIKTVPRANWKTVDWETIEQIVQGGVNQWMNSPGHRKNILNAEYDEAGIGIAQVNDYLIMTQVFITRASCGFQDGPCCEKTGYLPYCFIPLNCVQNTCQTAS